MGGFQKSSEFKTEKNHDHCWNQSKTMLLRDNVIIKLGLVIK